MSTYEPFIFAAQAQQVYYIRYPSLKNKEKIDWWIVCKVKPRLFSKYELDMIENIHEDANVEFFQSEETNDVQPTIVDESDVPIYLSKENEMEEVHPNEIKEGTIELTDFIVSEESVEEEELSSDLGSDDKEDEVELDICSTSEDEIDSD